MTNVEIARSPVQKEKPKPNGYIRSIFNEMTKSKEGSKPASQPASKPPSHPASKQVSKHKNDGKQMKDDVKDRLSLLILNLFSCTAKNNELVTVTEKTFHWM